MADGFSWDSPEFRGRMADRGSSYIIAGEFGGREPLFCHTLATAREVSGGYECPFARLYLDGSMGPIMAHDGTAWVEEVSDGD